MKKAKKSVKKTGHKAAKAAGQKAKKAPAVKRRPAPRRSAASSRRSTRPLPKGGAAEAFTKKEISEIQAELSEMRNDIAKAVDKKKALDMTEPEVGDSIDQAAQSLDKEILFELSDNERTMLDSIEAALRKIENGTYGVCEHCKKRIEKKRLKALPSARYCLLCQNGSERNRIQ
ncbi:MAG: TraR/DksA family transcriptional regulator [Elusimicrobia bacterium]|nr:TraR/DksA family transcriptional regulator [Elusimicrobiota bacterium]